MRLTVGPTNRSVVFNEDKFVSEAGSVIDFDTAIVSKTEVSKDSADSAVRVILDIGTFAFFGNAVVWVTNDKEVVSCVEVATRFVELGVAGIVYFSGVDCNAVVRTDELAVGL